MTYSTKIKTETGYLIKVQFWDGAETKAHWPYMDEEKMRDVWNDDFDAKLETSLKSVAQSILDFGLPQVGFIIDDDLGYNEVLCVSVRPFECLDQPKNITIDVYSEY